MHGYTGITRRFRADQGDAAASFADRSFCKLSLRTIQKTKMIKNQRIRRTIAAIMIVLGAILMLLAPEVWPGALLFVSGIVLELAGIALERKAD